ncbi:S-ribosylhomocysteine lyase [Marinifilum fragile]|uniref:S-ribosylhomocysteine lyase n=1 Tax=Marinifilum fragile TaxID=570161 RepID=UPI002AA81121|nr:S-ribosylhomocysteine lyase [Marinifilum fragile]
MRQLGEIFNFMADFEGEIPETNKIECGNYVSHDLTIAKWESDKYRKEVLSNLTEENLNYPQ